MLFDAVAVLPSADGAASLEHDAAAIDWVRDAYGHLKVIGAVLAADGMLTRAGADPDEGIVTINGPRDIAAFITAAKNGRIWERETRIRPQV